MDELSVIHFATYLILLGERLVRIAIGTLHM